MLQKQIEGNCIVCELPFMTDPRSHRKYCSPKCQRIKNKEANNRRTREWMKKNHEKRRAIREERHKDRVRLSTRRSFEKSGFCETCKKETITQFHHPKPYNRLIFSELCKLCHYKLHPRVHSEESKKKMSESAKSRRLLGEGGKG